MSLVKNIMSSTFLYVSSLAITHLLLVAVPSFPYASSDPCITADDIAINCGTYRECSSADPSGRFWSGDISSIDNEWFKFGLTEKPEGASIMSSRLNSPSTINIVPYNSSRLSTSEFSYSFGLSSGPKFVRLHFYHDPFPNFKLSTPLFSVRANDRYTLLSNFGADTPGSRPIVREFCIHTGENGLLKLSFIPAKSGCYTFINGIEVVSMPDNLYYSKLGDHQGLTYIGNPIPTFFRLTNSTALQTVQRLNLGGPDIPPRNDSGMFRSWYNDEKYLTSSGSSAFLVNQTAALETTDCAAPADLYRTARSMGTENAGCNLTWSFRIDSGFRYMVRLHFCDQFQVEKSKNNDREVRIYIANQTAESFTGAITGSGEDGAPMYKDYVVEILPKGNDAKQNMSISLNVKGSRILHSDAILNGIEVFKLSSINDSLVDLNQDVPRKGKKPQFFVEILAVGVLFCLAFTSLLCYFIVKQKRTQTRSQCLLGLHRLQKSLPRGMGRRFSLDEIKAATNDFDDSFIIGVGGFGDVYRGYMDGGINSVAIKRLKQGSNQGAAEFSTEIKMLSCLRHIHLVSLIGYCNEDGEMILVYDFMSRGTLCGHLYKTSKPPLPWIDRLKICIGAARGLHYLHTGADRTIIHRDVKSSNILLDDNLVAKVSDFGLSKIGPSSVSRSHVTTMVKGTFGYLDPEYFRFHHLTVKSDVYSFGVVLFEVLCARPPVNHTLEYEQVGLAQWATTCYLNQTLEQIIDPHLKGEISLDCLNIFASTAVSCLQEDRSKRPSMCDVLRNLESVLQLEMDRRQEDTAGGTVGMVENEDVRLRNTTDDDEDDNDEQCLKGRANFH